jgi:hypothetical protein
VRGVDSRTRLLVTGVLVLLIAVVVVSQLLDR